MTAATRALASAYRDTVRAMQLTTPAPVETYPLVAVELPDHEPEPDELVVQVSACAVCRTDLQVVEGEVATGRLPIVPGHQAVGRVVSVGRDVRGWDVGERAGVAWLASTCGACGFCTSERENLCVAATFTGRDRDGGFASHVTVRSAFALRIPDGFDDLDAAPLLCGGVIGYRALKVAGIRPGGRLGLYGFGASALLALQVARHWGCEIHVRTRSGRGQAEASALGATTSGPVEEPTPSLDAAVTFAPTGDAIVAALRALAPGATVAVNAIHLDRVPQFDYDLLWSERGVRSVANYTRADAREFLELAAAIGIRTSVQIFRLEEANAALADLAAGRLSGTAVLVP